MEKYKLPKNWIVVSSKSHPDRVYYFNVITNESMWKQPVANEMPLKHINKRHKTYDRKEECLRAMTPEHNYVEDKMVCHQQLLRNKIIPQTTEAIIKKKEEKDTPQMKILRERIKRKSQKSATKDKTSNVEKECNRISLSIRKSEEVKGVYQAILPSLRRSSSKLIQNEKVSSFSSKSTDYDKSVSFLNKNDNRTTTFTPQMCVLQQKIQQRRLGISNLDKKVEIGIESKRQKLQIPDETLKMQMEQKRNILNRESIDLKDDIKQNRRNRTKNLARDRMQKLRKSLSLENKIVEEIGSDTGTKRLQRLNSLLTSHCMRTDIFI